MRRRDRRLLTESEQKIPEIHKQSLEAPLAKSMNLVVSISTLGARKLPEWVSLRVAQNEEDVLYEAFIKGPHAEPVGVVLVSRATYQPERYSPLHRPGSLKSCPFVEIILLEVKEDFRRRGIGRELLKAISYDFPCENLILACTENNKPAYSLYTAMGFRILWVDALDNAPWFIKPSVLEKNSIKALVDILDSIYSIRCDFLTHDTGLRWREGSGEHRDSYIAMGYSTSDTG